MCRPCRTAVDDDALGAAAEFECKTSRMRVQRESAGRNAATVYQNHGLSGRHAVITRMPGIGEGLSAYLVARQHAGDHAGIAFRAAVEKRQCAVAMAEEAYHRRDAIMGAADRLRYFQRARTERIHDHRDQAITMHESFRRAANVTAVGQNLARDFVFETLE